jgi:hypothetical protein
MATHFSLGYTFTYINSNESCVWVGNMCGEFNLINLSIFMWTFYSVTVTLQDVSEAASFFRWISFNLREEGKQFPKHCVVLYTDNGKSPWLNIVFQLVSKICRASSISIKISLE